MVLTLLNVSTHRPDFWIKEMYRPDAYSKTHTCELTNRCYAQGQWGDKMSRCQKTQ